MQHIEVTTSIQKRNGSRPIQEACPLSACLHCLAKGKYFLILVYVKEKSTNSNG